MLSMQEEDTRKQIIDNLHIHTLHTLYVCMYVSIIDWVGVAAAAFC